MEKKEKAEDAAKQEIENTADQTDRQDAPKHAAGEIWFLGLMFLMILALFLDSLKLKGIFTGFTNPSSLPQIFLLLLFFLIILVTCRTLFRDKFKERSFKEAIKYLVSKDVVILLVMVLAYLLLLPFLHFTITSLIFLFGTMYLLDRRKPLQKLLISIGVIAGVQLIFHYLMQVVLP